MAVENIIHSQEAGSCKGHQEQAGDVRSPEQNDPKSLTIQPASGGLKPFLVAEIPEIPGKLQTPSPSPSPRRSSLVNESPYKTSKEPLIIVRAGNKHADALHQSDNPPSLTKENETDELSRPPPISKSLLANGLDDIPEEKIKNLRQPSIEGSGEEKVLKLSAAEMTELTSAPESLPMGSPKPTLTPNTSQSDAEGHAHQRSEPDTTRKDPSERASESTDRRKFETPSKSTKDIVDERRQYLEGSQSHNGIKRPTISSSSRAFTTQPSPNQWSSYSKPNAAPLSPKRKPFPINRGPEPLILNLEGLGSPIGANGVNKPSQISDLPPPSPIPQSIPLPPMSIPTYLQLELSATRPSPLYIYRSASTEFPYESSKVKFERLLNFLLLPPQLEQVLYFGSLACLDAWLYTFTILPLRFFNALGILISWWGHVLAKECRFITGFVYHGTSRMWQRRNERRSGESLSPTRSVSHPSRPSVSATTSYQSQAGRPSDAFRRSGTIESTPRVSGERRPRQGWGRRHRRMKSQPSSLSSYNKADLLQGAVIIFSSFFLMQLDASRMYHSIRAQSAIRLYVIYNLLEVCQVLQLLNHGC